MSDGARVLTTAEVESWQVALGRRWGARIGPRGHEVVIEGDRILATTRALEKLEEGLKTWHGRKGRDQAEADRDIARATVDELRKTWSAENGAEW